MEAVMPYVLALVPTIGVAVLFYVVIKTILEGDRRERIAQARWDAEHERRNDAQADAAQPRSSARQDDAATGESTSTPPTA